LKVTLESTTKTVDLVVNGQSVPARVWEGQTANGIACHAFITRIAVAKTDDAAEFVRDLAEQRQPSADIAAIPLRMVI
jgi:hypothetical protein